VRILEIAGVVDARAARVAAAEDARAAIGIGDRRARSADRVLAPGAGAPKVADEVVEARLAARAAAGRAEPVVEDVVAEVVEGASADFAPHARQAALLMGVKVVMNAELRVRTSLQQRTEGVAGVGNAARL